MEQHKDIVSLEHITIRDLIEFLTELGMHRGYKAKYNVVLDRLFKGEINGTVKT